MDGLGVSLGEWRLRPQGVAGGWPGRTPTGCPRTPESPAARGDVVFRVEWGCFVMF